MKSPKNIVLLLFIFSILGPSALAQKKVIKSQDDVPRFTYDIPSSASEVFSSTKDMDQVVNQLESDYQSLLEEYDIQDKTLKKGILGTLKNIDLYHERYDEALAKVEQIRGLQEKPSDKLLSGLSNMAYIKALKQTNYQQNQEFYQLFAQNFSELINDLPWEVVQDEVEGTKGTLEIYSENLALGLIKESIDPGVAKTGSISDDNASTLVNMNYVVNHVLPVKDHMIKAYEAYIAANKVEKPDIWADRDVDLSNESNLEPVIIAIWDSGIDVPIFENQVHVNPN